MRVGVGPGWWVGVVLGIFVVFGSRVGRDVWNRVEDMKESNYDRDWMKEVRSTCTLAEASTM